MRERLRRGDKNSTQDPSVPLSPGVDDVAAVWATCEEPCVVGTHGCVVVKKLPNIVGKDGTVAVLRGLIMHQTPPQRRPV